MWSLDDSIGLILLPMRMQATLDTNFYGTMNITEALRPILRDKTGRIVNVSSRWETSLGEQQVEGSLTPSPRTALEWLVLLVTC